MPKIADERRNWYIRKLRRQGLSVTAIAKRVGLSPSSIYRILGGPLKRYGPHQRESGGPDALALAILLLAIHDWQRPTKWAEKVIQGLGFTSLEEELLDFFESDWCQELLKLLGCDHLDLLELLRQVDDKHLNNR